MSDTTELKSRLEAALARIDAAAETLISASQEAPPQDDGKIDALEAALDSERQMNAQLEERVQAITDRQESLVSKLEEEVAELRAALSTRDGAVRHVRETNGKLRRTNRALRQANAQSVGDAALINEAMQAELEALRALQTADRAELDEVLSSLAPIVGEKAHA